MMNYLCPICRSHLRVGKHIVLSAKSSTNEKGLILFSPEAGNYSKETHPEFKIKKGEEHRFFCPVCHASLNDEDKINLVKILMEEENKLYDFYFSNIAGEEVTYRFDDHKAEYYGADRKKYEKYFDLPDKYKKYL